MFYIYFIFFYLLLYNIRFIYRCTTQHTYILSSFLTGPRWLLTKFSSLKMAQLCGGELSRAPVHHRSPSTAFSCLALICCFIGFLFDLRALIVPSSSRPLFTFSPFHDACHHGGHAIPRQPLRDGCPVSPPFRRRSLWANGKGYPETCCRCAAG